MSTVPAAWLCTPSLTCWTGWAANTEQALVGDIKAEAKVLGHTSEYAFGRDGTDHQHHRSSMFPCSVRQAGLSEGGKTAWQYVIWQTAYCKHIDEVQALE